MSAKDNTEAAIMTYISRIKKIIIRKLIAKIILNPKSADLIPLANLIKLLAH